MTQTPKVSVSFITYNQNRYVTEAIESVLMQRTDFRYEFVISDDFSTDGTREVCRTYQSRYPDRIRLIEREKNIGAVANYLETFKACRGEYVAYLEGDDCWIHPEKLQRQVDFLDTHPDFAICCHNVSVMDENGINSGNLLDGTKEVTDVTELCRGDYISTPSCMVRNGLLNEIPSWLYSLPGCDWAFDILNAEKGKIRFFPEVLAAYRVHAAGIWSGHSAETRHRMALDIISILNEKLEYKYDSSFETYRFRLLHAISSQAHDELQIKHEVLKSEYDRLNTKFQATIESLAHLQEERTRPWFQRLKGWIKASMK